MAKENQKEKDQQNKISEQLAEEKKNNKLRMDQLIHRQKASIQMHTEKQNTLSTEIEQKDAKIINLQAELSKSIESS